MRKIKSNEIDATSQYVKIRPQKFAKKSFCGKLCEVKTRSNVNGQMSENSDFYGL